MNERAPAQLGTLLVVDDEELNRDILCRRLGRQGYAVLTAGSGREALELLKREAVDLVLLDMMMPDTDGLSVLRSLRPRHALAELPVIMVTARDASEAIVEALEAGANDYVVKPFDFTVALARIRTQLAVKQAEAALKASQARYELVARASNDGIWDWDVAADRCYFSPRLKALLGYGEAGLGERFEDWLALVYAEDQAAVRAALQTYREGCSSVLQLECRMHHRNGSCVWILNRAEGLRDAGGRLYRLAGSCADLTAYKAYDGLTGLPNALLFADRLERCGQRRERHPLLAYAVLLVSLDRFHLVHESLGQAAANHCLAEQAQRLGRLIRPSDTLAYLGGVKFAILLDYMDRVENGLRVAERVQQAFAEPLRLGDQDIVMAASQGLAYSSQGGDLLQNAEAALGRAKELGGGRHQLFDETVHARAVALLRLENELRHGLSRREFCVYYQAIVDLHRGGIAGFEALVRWQHPEHGLVPPADFIPLAERTGLIIPLGLQVLQEALAQVQHWQQHYQPALSISVNLSCKQFKHKNLVKDVADCLEATPLNRHSLKLEITESAIMDDADSADTLLARFKALDIQLAIDDFGTGYSSLNYLHRFPVDILKIDRSFVATLDQDPQDLEIVRTVVRLAHALHLEVVAEGVETPAQLALLRELGCNYGQGYLFAQPLPAPEAEALLRQEPHW